MPFSRLLLLVFALTAPALAWQQGHGGADDMGEQLKSLLHVTDPSTGFILVALGVSFLAGAAHAGQFERMEGIGSVVVGGRVSDNRLFEELSGLAPDLEIYNIGDSVRPRDIFSASHEAAHVAELIRR